MCEKCSPCSAVVVGPNIPLYIFQHCDDILSTSLLSSTDTTSYSFQIIMIFVQTVRIKQKQPGILISTCIKLNIFSGCYPLNHNMKTGVKNSKIQLCTQKIIWPLPLHCRLLSNGIHSFLDVIVSLRF